jgi:hypothetical protein
MEKEVPGIIEEFKYGSTVRLGREGSNWLLPGGLATFIMPITILGMIWGDSWFWLKGFLSCFLVLIISIFLGNIHDARIARRKLEAGEDVEIVKE